MTSWLPFLRQLWRHGRWLSLIAIVAGVGCVLVGRWATASSPSAQAGLSLRYLFGSGEILLLVGVVLAAAGLPTMLDSGWGATILARRTRRAGIVVGFWFVAIGLGVGGFALCFLGASLAGSFGGQQVLPAAQRALPVLGCRLISTGSGPRPQASGRLSFAYGEGARWSFAGGGHVIRLALRTRLVLVSGKPDWAQVRVRIEPAGGEARERRFETELRVGHRQTSWLTLPSGLVDETVHSGFDVSVLVDLPDVVVGLDAPQLAGRGAERGGVLALSPPRAPGRWWLSWVFWALGRAGVLAAVALIGAAFLTTPLAVLWAVGLGLFVVLPSEVWSWEGVAIHSGHGVAEVMASLSSAVASLFSAVSTLPATEDLVAGVVASWSDLALCGVGVGGTMLLALAIAWLCLWRREVA